MAEKILAIDARMGKRGRRKTMEFAGSMVQSEIDAYKEEMKMTSSELSQYRSETKEYMETAQQVASDGIAVVAEAKEAITKAQKAAEDAAAAAKEASASIDDAKKAASDAETAKTGAETAQSNAETAVTNASGYADNAKDYATNSQSWAVGGTGTRTGEDTNNAKYWCEQAQGTVTGVSSFNGRSGAVTPQTGDYSYSQISGTPTAATSSSDGLMSKSDKAKLDGVATGANKTVTDTAVTENSSNPVSSSGIYAAINAVKDSIVSTVTDAIGSIKTAIGNASASAAGLMSAADKTKLDGIAEGATKVAVDSAVTEGSSNAASSGGVFVAIKAVKDSIVDTVISAIESIRTAIGDATTSARGLMTAADKTKLNGVAEGANKTTLIDNLTTTTAGLGALDAHAGYSLKQDLANGRLVAEYSNAFVLRGENTSWKDKEGLYYYEGADTSTYDIPYPYCFVLHFGRTDTDTARGAAICLRWADLGSYSSSTTIWTNGNQNGWNEWRAVN